MGKRRIHCFIFMTVLTLLLFVLATPVMATVVTCDPPPSGMVAWWPGDGNAYDIQGGNNGTLQGGATFAAGKVGQAFSFGGVNDYVDAGTSDLFNFNNGTGDFTVDAWIRLDAYPQYPNAAGIVGKATHGIGNPFSGPYTGWVLLVLPDGTLAFTGTGIWNIETASGLVTIGNWAHVAVTKNGNTYTLYFNGSPSPSTIGGSISNLVTSPASLKIGTAYDDFGFFTGLIDEVEIFNRALSGTEIAAIYNAGSAGKCKTSVTVPAATGNGNITLQTSNPGCAFTNYYTKTAAQVGNDVYSYPYGLVGFTLNCTPADVTITFPGSISGTTYRKYGPTTPGVPSTTTWYTFTNVTVNGSNSIILHLIDGQLGDDTGVDGIIVDQGGPADPPASVPTMNEWGMIIFMLLAGLGSVYYLRRSRTTNR